MGRPLRICYVGWGDHVHLERWAGYFAKAGHDVRVLSYSGLGDYPPGVKQVRIGFDRQGPSVKRWHIRWQLWRRRPDVVHVHYTGFTSYVREVWQGPTIVTAWGSDIYRLHEKPPEAQARVKQAIVQADALTCDSEDLRRAIVELCPSLSGRVEIVQWGVDTGHFRRISTTDTLRRELRAEGRPVILSARNFDPLYNLETVVHAFHRVHQSVPEALLILKNHRGLEDYKAKVMALVNELGLGEHVRLVESIPYERMPELYSLAVASVSIPSSDATPMSLLEAMACGCVPVCSDLPSLREWIDDARNGFLVPVHDPGVIAERLVYVLRNPPAAHGMAAANVAIVEQRASQAAHMHRMSAIYERVAGTGGISRHA